MVHLREQAPLARSFANQLADIERRLVSGWSIEAPEAGFAEWASAISATPLPLPGFDLAVGKLSSHRWAEAPVLAGLGFRLAARTSVSWADRWLAGVQRLMLRDPAPADRNSFLFRPVELLGLVLGAAATEQIDPRPRAWLQQAIDDHRSRIGASSIWSQVLLTLAEDRVGIGRPRPSLSAETQFDIALMLWLHMADERLARSLTPVDLPQLERELLSRAAESEIEFQNLAKQSVYAIALRRAVIAAVGDLDIHPSHPAELVMALCRRFPLLVKELGRRHDHRAQFKISDEYDVQDLLRGILRLHFSDVQAEEWNPSYGGVQSRSDLLLKPERIVIETKMTRASLGQRELVKQLIVDKEQYRGHPHCGTLICFTYDPEQRLQNTEAIERDLSEKAGQPRTLVVISPQGL